MLYTNALKCVKIYAYRYITSIYLWTQRIPDIIKGLAMREVKPST